MAEKIDTNICPNCKEFCGYNNEDLKEMGQTETPRMLDCKNCGEPTIKLLAEDNSLEKKLGFGSTSDINLDEI